MRKLGAHPLIAHNAHLSITHSHPQLPPPLPQHQVTWQVQIWMPTVKQRHAGLRGKISVKVLEDICVALQQENLL